jgi:hypothetical protein
MLFLFFGYFGGRNSLSRYLMLWGAPLCFILQARPVKMWGKILFYMMVNPPGIVLSLLAAPQQAILSIDFEKSFSALYGASSEEHEIGDGELSESESEIETIDSEFYSEYDSEETDS